MIYRIFFALTRMLAIIFLLSINAGCSTNPKNLDPPSKYRCAQLEEPLIKYSEIHNTKTMVFLAAGPYISEKVDDNGVYYRGPSGAIFMGHAGDLNSPQDHPLGNYFDGGVYYPNDKSQLPRLYMYRTRSNAKESFNPQPGLKCINIQVIVDPKTEKLSIVAYAASGALGGALAGAAAKSVADNSKYSYGESMAIGALGGAAAGAVIAVIDNSTFGNIFVQPASDDDAFNDSLKLLESQATEVKRSF